MLSTCEFRDEFSITDLQNSHCAKDLDNAELFSHEKSDAKTAFIDSNLLSIEPESDSFEKQLNKIEDDAFAISSLVQEPCFKKEKHGLIEDKDQNCEKALNECEKRKIGCIEDINEKNTAHLNKRKRAVVRKNSVDLGNDGENIFDDDEGDIVLEKIQPNIELDYIHKKHRQVGKTDIGSKPPPIVLIPEQIKIKRAKALPEKATKIMKSWFEANIHNPYPTDEERKFMAEQGEISENQVKAWFANKRNRSSNTKSKLKSKTTEEQTNMVTKDKLSVKKSDFYPKNFEQTKCKFSPVNLQACAQYLPNMDIYNYADKHPMNSRYVCKQPQVNNFSNYYSYFPKQESKLIDINNNYFNQYLNQSNNCDYNRYYSNMYSPISQNESFMNQNFVNSPSANNYQYFEHNFGIPCQHSFTGFNDASINECNMCVNCNQDGVQGDVFSPNAQTQRCDTPPPIVTRNSVRSGEAFLFDEPKSDTTCSVKNPALVMRNSQAKFQNIHDSSKHENFNACNFAMSGSNLQYSDFGSMQSNNNFIKSSMIPESLNNESVTTILDSLNQAQNNLCIPSVSNCCPSNEYNGSTVTINNINYTNPNGSLINSISSILTKPGSIPSSSTSSVDSTSPNSMCINNGNESFGNMFNMAFNSIINRNSPFQKYGCQKSSKSARISANSQYEHDSRFSDVKAKEWCMKSHPKLANTLLNSKANCQQNECLAESKCAQHYQNYG